MAAGSPRLVFAQMMDHGQMRPRFRADDAAATDKLSQILGTVFVAAGKRPTGSVDDNKLERQSQLWAQLFDTPQEQPCISLALGNVDGLGHHIESAVS